MPNDYITLKTLTNELNDTLFSAKISRIFSPCTGEFCFSVRANGNNRTLLLSASALPRVYLTKNNLGNGSGEIPSSFCMLLRKRLDGGRIVEISLLDCDRILSLLIETRNELHDSQKYRLILELFSNGANLILTDEKLEIIDAYKRVFGDGERCILTGYTYKTPSKHKETIENNKLIKALDSLPFEDAITKLSSDFIGFSKESLAEIKLTASLGEPLSDVINRFLNAKDSGISSPSVLYNDKDIPEGYFIMPYKSITKGTFKPFKSLSDAVSEYFSLKESSEKKLRETKELFKLVKKLKQGTKNKIEECRNTVATATISNDFLEKGELIKCYMGKIKRGDNKLTCFNFYTNEETTIALDSTLSPQKNAEKYFKKYNKIKGAVKYAKDELAKLLERYDYLESLEEAINVCDTKQEYSEIENELIAISGSKKNQPVKKKKEKPSVPLSFEISGYKIYIGKNNIQNDEVTFKIASGNDLWLHTKTYHGSHGIIISNGKNVPDNVVKRVAEVVSYFSNARDLPKAEVDYTIRKHVKKLGKPGLVTYTEYKSIVVTPKKFD